MNLNKLEHIFFIGIGGIGMSALARYFNDKGVLVAGYDKTETALTKKLVDEGMEIHYEDDVNLVPKDIDMVIYTPAIPDKHKQLRSIKDTASIPIYKRSEVLGMISENGDAIAVGGTHGKTTTSGMAAHIIRACGIDASAFIGGILSDYNTNYFMGESPWVVLEADEYDRSFLSLVPEIAILQSMDADHLDIYGDKDSIKSSFVDFLNKTSFGGTVLINHDLISQFSSDELKDLRSHYKVITYGVSLEADGIIKEASVDNGMTRYTLHYKGEVVEVRQYLPGMHNRMNSTAAILACVEAGCNLEEAANSLSVFKGIKRRYEFVFRRDVTFIDDYAHHPTELKAVIEATRELFPSKKVLGIFQPHLYSRTKDFYKEFAEALDGLDEVVLMDIYPAREEPMKGVSSELILNKMKLKNKSVLSSIEIIDKIKEKDFDVVMTLGAGDIDLLVPQVKALLA